MNEEPNDCRLSQNQIRKIVLQRMEEMSSACNSSYLSHSSALLRGLIWALNGEDPGRLSRSAADVCRVIGFKVRDCNGDEFHYAMTDDELETEMNKCTDCLSNRK